MSDSPGRWPIISIDGAIVPPAGAVISVLDRGLLYGDGLFEVLRTWGGVAVDLDAHLARLQASAEALQLRVPAGLRGWVLAAVAAAAAPVAADARVRIVVTRGPGGVRERLADLGGGRAIVIVEPLSPAAASAHGVRLITLAWPRPLGHKALAYLPHLLARELAVAAGADDAILVVGDEIVECATANLFLVSENLVATPPTASGALPGIVRGRVLAACAQLGLAATARRITAQDLRAADEIFVTSAVRGVVGVTALDGDAREPGPVTARLAAHHGAEMSALAGAIRDRGLL